jgi:hypothetical protein
MGLIQNKKLMETALVHISESWWQKSFTVLSDYFVYSQDFIVNRF